MPKVRAAALEIFELTINTGHASGAWTVVSTAVTTAVEYTAGQILASLDPTKPAPQLSYEEEVLLRDVGVIGGGFEVVTEEGVIKTETVSDAAVQQAVTTVTSATDAAVVPLDALRYMNTYFQEPYLTKGPPYMGPWQGYSALWKLFADKIAESDDPDVRLLVYRDALDTMYRGRNMFMDLRRQENELTALRDRYEAAMVRLNGLLQKMATESLAQFQEYCGSMGILIKQPKPMIYAQAILNIEMAWYLYLYGGQIDPLIYPSVVEYVKALGTKEQAYDKLITLLDEKYVDDQQEWNKYVQEVASSLENSSNEPTSGSSGGCTSSGMLTSSEGSDYCSDAEDYYPFPTYDTMHIVGDWQAAPIYMTLGPGLKDMLVIGGRVNIDVFDKYEAEEAVVQREQIRSQQKLAGLQYLVDPRLGTDIKQWNNRMLMLDGGLYIDIQDKYERGEKEARIEYARTMERRRRDGTYLAPTARGISRLTYMLDPENPGGDGHGYYVSNSDGTTTWKSTGKMLMLQGSLAVDIMDKFEKQGRRANQFIDDTEARVNAAIRAANKKSSARHRRKHKKTKTRKKARYILDPVTNVGGMLVVKGAVGMTLGDMFGGQHSCVIVTPGDTEDAPAVAQYIEDDFSPFEGRILIMEGGLSVAVDQRFTEEGRRERLRIAEQQEDLFG